MRSGTEPSIHEHFTVYATVYFVQDLTQNQQRRPLRLFIRFRLWHQLTRNNIMTRMPFGRAGFLLSEAIETMLNCLPARSAKQIEATRTTIERGSVMLKLFACLLLLHVGGVAAATVADDCMRDLDALPAFLLENDAGAPLHLAQKGPEFFAAALTAARNAAAQAKDDLSCEAIMRDYLFKWRKDASVSSLAVVRAKRWGP